MEERQQAFLRSQASSNWRVKSDTPQPNCPPQNYQSSHDRSSDSQHTNDNTQGSSVGTRLYVGNLLYTIQREDVENLFSTNGFQICGMSMSIDPFTGRNPSYAFVDIETPDIANRAMQTLNGTKLSGRPVKIKPGVEKAGDRIEFRSRVRNYQQGWGKRQEYGQVENYSPTFDRWNRHDAPTHTVAPLMDNRRLYVGNIPRIEPQAALDAEIQQLFSGFDLSAVSKIINPLRKRPEMASIKANHYFCFVDFATSEEAERAAAKVDRKVGSWGGMIKVQKARDERYRKVIRE